MKYFARAIALSALAFFVTGLSGCHLYKAMNEGPVLNPKTGPGTDYPCAEADGVYCGDHTCCHHGERCEPDRCDATAYAGNTEWIGASKKSHPRIKAVR